MPVAVQAAFTRGLDRRWPAPLRVGVDVVCIGHIRDSLRQFGERFVQRLFTQREAAYALAAEACRAERLAARFAAKEATIKVFGWSEAGVSWREIEVVRADNGACHLELHGHAARLVSRQGAVDLALNLSHDGDYAVAMVAALPTTSATHRSDDPRHD